MLVCKWIKELLNDPGMLLFVICLVLLMLGIAMTTGDFETICMYLYGGFK